MAGFHIRFLSIEPFQLFICRQRFFLQVIPFFGSIHSLFLNIVQCTARFAEKAGLFQQIQPFPHLCHRILLFLQLLQPGSGIVPRLPMTGNSFCLLDFLLKGIALAYSLAGLFLRRLCPGRFVGNGPGQRFFVSGSRQGQILLNFFLQIFIGTTDIIMHGPGQDLQPVIALGME